MFFFDTRKGAQTKNKAHVSGLFVSKFGPQTSSQDTATEKVGPQGSIPSSGGSPKGQCQPHTLQVRHQQRMAVMARMMRKEEASCRESRNQQRGEEYCRCFNKWRKMVNP